MKKLIFGGLLAVFMLSTAFAQRGSERTGYDGDYFSLEGALDLFKQSYTLRDFERKLNTESNWVNNLDLNYDGRIDYIRVEHRRQGDFHAIILQAILDRHDVQDVAVIEIDVIGRREAILQIVGDEDLYGEEVIVEPIEGYTDSRSGYQSDNDDYVNVYYWTPVQYILGRQYTVYASPYRWQYYPTWWSPWRPCAWNVFRPRIVIYTRYFTVVHRHRVVHVHNFYRNNYRSYSNNVVQRTNQVRVKQGKAPIYRSAPVVQQDNRNPSDYRSRNDVEERSSATTRANSSIENSSNSRKRDTQSADNQYPTRSSTPSVDQRSRSAETSPGRSRSNVPAQQPDVRSRNTTPSASQKATPPTDQRYRSTEDSPARSRSNPPARQPEVSSRNTTPSANRQATRSSSPEVKQPSRSAASSSPARTAPRSTSPSPKSSASSRSASASKPQATRSTPSKSSSSTKSESRSRKGGND